MNHLLPRCRRSRLAGFVFLAAAAMLPLAGLPAGAADDAPPLDLEIVDLAPVVLAGDADLRLTVAATNTTDAPIDEATVTLRAQEWTPNTRTSLEGWLDPGRYRATRTLQATTLTVLAAGERREFEFSVPAADFRFDAWGPRGVEVRADPVAAGVALDPDRERTWVLWWNEPRVSPTEVGVLAPVTPTVEELSGYSPGLVRLRTLLQQATLPGVTPALDPVILSLADEDPQLDALLTAEATARAATSFLLPWANADATALLHGGRSPLYHSLLERGTAALDAAGARAAGTLDWPTTPDLATLAGTTGDVVVLPSTAFPELAALTYTRDARATVEGRAAVVTDSGLTTAIADAVTSTGATLTPLQQRQFVAATLAVVTRERPNDSRLVLLALPFDDDGAAAPIIEAIATLPWVTPVRLAEVLTPEAPPLSSAGIAAEPELPEGALTAADLARLEAVTDDVLLAERMAADPAAFTEPLISRLALQPSATWREQPAARAVQLDEVAATARALTAGVAVSDSSPILMVNDSANFPVRLTSTAPVDAVVRVNLLPSDRRMDMTSQVVTVPAGGEILTRVPVTAVGWGDLVVTVRLSTEFGEWLGQPVQIPVRIRADWEDVALTTLTAGAAVAFLFGIYRTVRRNRATGRAAQMEAVAEELDAATREPDQEMA